VAQTLYDSIIHADGESGPVGALARTWIGRDSTLHIRVVTTAGYTRSAEPPVVSLDTTTDGGEWTELVALGPVDGDVVAADATLRTAPTSESAGRWNRRSRRSTGGCGSGSPDRPGRIRSAECPA
jgi:hypothetical protein